MTNQTAIALTIAGSDSGGGAGIQADLKAMSALGAYGASVITALTAQNTTEVRAIQDVPAEFIACQIDTVLDDLNVNAIKIGMLSQVDVIEAVADRLKVKASGIPVVLDPVMVAKSGDKLLQDNAVEALRKHLVPLATLMTPNLPEAGVLLDREAPKDADTMRDCGEALMELGAKAVLMKGGHLTGDDCIDLLMREHADVLELHSKRVHTGNTHGTGCTLSASIAALLARGMNLEHAVANAHSYLANAIQAADQLEVGQGHGPVHHFHQFWSKL